MGLLYFVSLPLNYQAFLRTFHSFVDLIFKPDEHKFAVYTPLFAPIAVPLIIGLLRELLSRRKRGKAVEYTEKSQNDHAMLDEIQEGAVHGTATSQVDINEKEKTMGSSGGSLSDNSPLHTIRSRVIHE